MRHDSSVSNERLSFVSKLSSWRWPQTAETKGTGRAFGSSVPQSGLVAVLHLAHNLAAETMPRRLDV